MVGERQLCQSKLWTKGDVPTDVPLDSQHLSNTNETIDFATAVQVTMTPTPTQQRFEILD
jgi:hypothetical protein